jgi:hypothetical protein
MTITTSAASAPASVPVAVTAAWKRYLWATSGVSGAAYEDREERAWERLVRELAELGCAPRPRVPTR